jgi:hypothetical protein
MAQFERRRRRKRETTGGPHKEEKKNEGKGHLCQIGNERSRPLRRDLEERRPGRP